MPREKPPKPYPDFPLYPHANGQWAKKIRQKTRFFGPWADWRGALEEYERMAGVEPTPEAFDLDDLVNLFLAAKKKEATSGEVKWATWQEYKRAAGLMLDILGRATPVEHLRGDHFMRLREKLVEQIPNPVTLRNTLVKIRVICKWAYSTDKVVQPLRYEHALKRPPTRLIRAARNEAQKKLYSHKEICTLIDKASGYLKPAIYLAINAALGNRDVCELEWEFIDGHWMDFPRPKTACHRKAWLWPETIKALKAWRKESPESRWVCCGERGQQLGQGDSNNTPIAHLFSDLLEACKIEPKGRGFYSLRHTFRTVADNQRDHVAIRLVMGHADHSIDGQYRESIEAVRVKAVCEFVHGWFTQTAQSPAS